MNETTEIASARLSIVPFCERHLTDRYVGWLNDAEVVRYSEQRFTRHTLESCRKYWMTFRGSPHYFWAIETSGGSSAGEHIGNINAYLDPRHGLADVGILIGERSAWGKGYGTEAWIAVCDWLLRSAGVRKITAGTLSCNHGMIAIMDRAGMIEDGRRSRQQILDGGEVDIIHRALFACDWDESIRVRNSVR